LSAPAGGSGGEVEKRPPEKIRDSIRRRRRKIDATAQALERKLSPPEPVLEAWARTRAGMRVAAAVVRELTPERHKGLTALAAMGLVALAMRSRIARYGMALTVLALGVALTRSPRSGAESTGNGPHSISESASTRALAGGQAIDRPPPGEASRI
jgi:tetrahydromethanopterin S-methyltransferase subunit B